MIAPQAPPCFDSRLQWVEYLRVADVDMRDTKIGPMRCGRDGAYTFNRSFDFCEDCEPEYRAAMQKADRCRPDWLKDQK